MIREIKGPSQEVEMKTYLPAKSEEEVLEEIGSDFDKVESENKRELLCRRVMRWLTTFRPFSCCFRDDV